MAEMKKVTESSDSPISMEQAAVIAECSFISVRRAVAAGQLTAAKYRGRVSLSERQVRAWAANRNQIAPVGAGAA